jgi:two-component system chemotaxis response regulator CheY
MVGNGVKIVMITALGDGESIMQSFREACDGYVVKPIDKARLLEELRKLDMIS